MSALQNIAIRGEPAGLLFFEVCSCQRWQTQKGAAMSDILEFSGDVPVRKENLHTCLSGRKDRCRAGKKNCMDSRQTPQKSKAHVRSR